MRGAWSLVVAGLVVATSLSYFVSSPLTGDDDYVIHNLASPRLGEALLAFNVDLVHGEGGQTTWYEGFSTLQRRYLRVVPGAVMALEYRLFGSNPIGLKSVSLLIHLANLWLGFCLLRRYVTDPRTALFVVTLVGLHPAAAECVGWFSCQPILMAGTASLVAVHALLRLREAPTVGRRLRFVTASIVLLFTYEAAVALPLLMIALDWWWRSRPGARRPADASAAAAVLLTYPVYVAAMAWNRAGTTLTDASYRAGLGEILLNTRADLANYVVKLLPMPPYGESVYAAIGSWAGTAAVALAAGAWLYRMGPSRTRTAGLAVFLLALSPSLLTRAAVSTMNFPSLRQLYLPLAGCALLLCAWRPSGLRRTGLAAGAFVIILLMGLYHLVGPRRARAEARAAHAEAGRQLSGFLSGVRPDTPILQVGDSTCGYSLEFDSGGRDVWKLVPPTVSGVAPLLRVIDTGTLEAEAPAGDGLAFATQVPVDPRRRRARSVPALLTAGRQDLGPAQAHSPRWSGPSVRSFRLSLDRPLADWVVVAVSGCVSLDRWSPGAASK